MPALVLAACSALSPVSKEPKNILPARYASQSLVPDTANGAYVSWRQFFENKQLEALIDTALSHNQELNIALQEIDIAKNEVRARKAEYLPFGNGYLGGGADKVGRFTRFGALEKNLEIKPGKPFPDPFTDAAAGIMFNWEVDVWKRLRNAKKAAVMRYYATMEGRNFMVTNLIAEIGQTYYELQALHHMLNIVNKNIEIQSNALRVVRQQKESAKVTQLAVNRFEAQLLNTQNLQYAIKQQIVEAENRLRFLTGKSDMNLEIDTVGFFNPSVSYLQVGIPAQLLTRRPDVRQAQWQFEASKLDVASAQALFYPAVSLRAGMGFQAFNPALLLNPESLIYNLAGDLLAPAINRNAIKAQFASANARQLQAVYNLEQTMLNAYVEVLNQLSRAQLFTQSYEVKKQEVDILNQSVGIANNLFNSARADYAEVLLTQREALEARMQLVEIKLQQQQARVMLYRALGGGWQ